MNKRYQVRCTNGHYYNAEKLRGCPICNSSSVMPQSPEIHQNPVIPQGPGIPQNPGIPQRPVAPQNSVMPQQPVTPQRPAVPQNPNAKNPSGNPVREHTVALLNRPPNQLTPTTIGPEQVITSAPPVALSQNSLQEAVDAVTSHKGAEEVKTVAIWNAPPGSDPVVGWLVCIKGEYIGQSFSLKSGNNFVGRAMDMDIHLAQEPSVSRNRHCIITYEPNDQVFYIQQGESSGLTYLNGDMVMAPTKINERDIIRIGDTAFLLIPLCVNGFRWEEYISESCK